MTYKQAYDKIIEAYFKDEIQPWDAHFCFCGSLCDNTTKWFSYQDSHGYTGVELKRMERALLYTMYTCKQHASSENTTPEYEDALFKGMCAALDVLREIHKQRGEDVDSVPALTKRVLV